jgi:glyoxylase-like metal-dependent hydrolase (beta-lactamase superfamily II)
MYFRQFYLGCLAHASYLIGSEGEAAIIDPQRDVEQYIVEAEAQGLKIKYVIETHLHADFVSGHRELAARTEAEIVAVAIQSKLAALRYLARIDLRFNRDSALEVSRMKRKVLIAARNGVGLRGLPCADHR